MCILLVAYKAHPDYEVILAANRDEFHARPTAPAAFWEENPQVLGGRDLQAGGAWMGVTRQGRLAALTNIRDPKRLRQEAPSRGGLVSAFLTGGMPPNAYLEQISRTAALYNPFNLLAGSPGGLFCYSGIDGAWGPMQPGFHGVSNWNIDTPWPKVVKGKKGLKEAVEGNPAQAPGVDALFAVLADTTTPPDDQLPDTGVGLEWERVLGSIFVAGPGYGTRSSTVLMISRRGEVFMEERSFGADGPAQMTGVRQAGFSISSP